MIDGVKGNNKDWIGLDNATKDKGYQKIVDEQVSSIMNGKETISKSDLQKNSLFANLSGDALKTFDQIAAMDEGAHFAKPDTFSKSELKALFTFADAKKNSKGELSFDGKIDDANSSLAGINKKDIITAMLNESAMTDYKDVKTGKQLNVLEVAQKFESFEKSFATTYNHDPNKSYYTEASNQFEKETGVKVGFMRLRGGDIYKIGDFNVNCNSNNKIIENYKNGINLKLDNEN